MPSNASNSRGWDVTKNAPQMAIIQLGAAFKNFFVGHAKHPQFKKKGKSRDRFTLTNDQFTIDACRIRIPNLGSVRMREALRFSGKILSATVSRTADQWFASMTVDTDSNHLPLAENQSVVGVGFARILSSNTGKAPCTDCQHPQGYLALTHHGFDSPFFTHRHRRFERIGYGEEPPFIPCHQRHGLF